MKGLIQKYPARKLAEAGNRVDPRVGDLVRGYTSGDIYRIIKVPPPGFEGAIDYQAINVRTQSTHWGPRTSFIFPIHS